MKVLLVNKYYSITGGADKYFFELKNILVAKGHEVIPFCGNYSNNFDSEYEQYFPVAYSGEEVEALPFKEKIKIFLKGIYNFEARKNIERLIRDVQPDLVHLHNIFYTISPSIVHSLKKYKLPIVCSLHDYHIICANAYLYHQGICQRCKSGKYYNILIKRCYRNSLGASMMAFLSKLVHNYLKIFDNVDIFTVPNVMMKNNLMDWGLPEQKIKIIHNPFDFSGLVPNYQYRNYFVFYGLIAQQKGVLTLLRAMRQVKDSQLLMFGKGPGVEDVKRYIKENKLENVRLDTELRWGKKLRKIISNAMFVISPSEWLEPSAYMNYESMALGKPVIASRIGGNIELISEEKNGLLFEPGNAKELAEKINFLLKNRYLIEKFGRNARLKLEEELNIEKHFTKLMEIYKEAINKN